MRMGGVLVVHNLKIEAQPTLLRSVNHIYVVYFSYMSSISGNGFDSVL